MALIAAKDIRELRRQFAGIKSTVAGDTRFSATAILFLSESLIRIEKILEAQLKLAQKADTKARKRPLTEWQRFFAAGMKAGKTPAEIGAEWRADDPLLLRESR